MHIATIFMRMIPSFSIWRTCRGINYLRDAGFSEASCRWFMIEHQKKITDTSYVGLIRNCSGNLTTLAWNSYRNDVRWAALYECYRIHVNGTQKQSLVTSHIDNPVALAYDWIHRNLYWADVGLHFDRARIEVLALVSGWRHTLFDDSMVRSPAVMVVDPRPEQGY